MPPLVSKKVECRGGLHPEPVYVAERTRVKARENVYFVDSPAVMEERLREALKDL
jgi:hypothetical protein